MRPTVTNSPEGNFPYNLSNSNFLKVILLFIVLSGLRVAAQDPTVTVRFANPEYDCITQNFSADVEFQCDIANKQLNMMNVRFYYQYDVLEFLSFGEFVSGYGLTNPNPPIVTPTDSVTVVDYFSFDGAAVYVNGGIIKSGFTSLKLSTTGWTKIFNVNFHVVDPTAFNSPGFYPSLIWDLKEDHSGGFTQTSSGIVIILTNVPNSNENVHQFNWEYDTDPGLPYGFPNETYGVSTICGYAPKTILPEVQNATLGPIDIPVKVVDFENIGTFSLAFEYDSTVLSYVSYSANSIFNGTNGYLNVSTTNSGNNKRLIMTYSGLGITLADSSNLAILSFYLNGGSTPLTWITDDAVSFYRNGNNILLCDDPESLYYFGGNVEGVESFVAPVTKIDSTVAIQGDMVTFNVRIWNYTNIHSGLLTLDFNSNVLSFYQAIPANAIASAFNSQIISPGRLQMDWLGDATLDDGSTLVYIVFSNLGGISPLEWYDIGTTCQYVSSVTNEPLVDEPTCEYYINGNVAPIEFNWTGDISSDWNNPGNWDVGLVPDGFTDVTIDPDDGISVYPTFSGDFSVGTQCKRLTLLSGAQLFVLGDFTINPGHTFEMIGASILHIGGNWTNSGIFNPGAGIIEFEGTDDAAIAEGVSPENYIEAYVYNTFEAGMTPITGGMSGPTGNNAHSDVNIGFTFRYLGVDYTQLRINTNGWVSLDLSGNDATSNDNSILFDARTPTNTFAPWWDDLTADGTTVISYKTEGTAPSRIFTVEWRHILAFSTGATSRLNFQVKLYETSNVIEFCYGNVENGTHNTAEGASIGLKNCYGGMGHFLEASHNSTNLIFICLTSSNDWPQVNYRFTPPVPNEMDTFYYLMVSKTGANLSIQRDVNVIGQE